METSKEASARAVLSRPVRGLDVPYGEPRHLKAGTLPTLRCAVRLCPGVRDAVQFWHTLGTGAGWAARAR